MCLSTKENLTYEACWSLLYGMLKATGRINKLNAIVTMSGKSIRVTNEGTSKTFKSDKVDEELISVFNSIYDVHATDDRFIELIRNARVCVNGNASVKAYYNNDILVVDFRPPYTMQSAYVIVYRDKLWISTCAKESAVTWLENAIV